MLLMLRLTPEQLDNTLTTIQIHGYGDFFRNPPELSLLLYKWDEMRNELVHIDLDQYEVKDSP